MQEKTLKTFVFRKLPEKTRADGGTCLRRPAKQTATSVASRGRARCLRWGLIGQALQLWVDPREQRKPLGTEEYLIKSTWDYFVNICLQPWPPEVECGVGGGGCEETGIL